MIIVGKKNGMGERTEYNSSESYSSPPSLLLLLILLRTLVFSMLFVSVCFSFFVFFPLLFHSKHHAIHIQHTTAAGVFLGVAVSLGAGAFPEGLLASCLALSAGATFHLASGTVLAPVLAIPANVGGPVQALLEVAALATGAAGVVGVGLAESWAGIGH